MKLIFNNDKELIIDYFSIADGMMCVKSQWSPKDYFEEIFKDPLGTSKIIYVDSEMNETTYENYTQFEEIREDKNGILTIIMSQNGHGTIDRINTLESEIKHTQENVVQAQNDIKTLQEGGAGINHPAFDAMLFIARESAQTFEDEIAVTVKAIYETWNELVDKEFTAEKAGFKFTHEDVLYKTIKAGQSFQKQWVPGNGTESIFTRIDETHAGTKEDPIPYNVNMEVFEDKYYTEDGILYKCTRNSGQALHNKASELVGHYFEIVEN